MFTQKQVDDIVARARAAGATAGCDHKQNQFSIKAYTPPNAFALAMVIVGGWWLQSDLELAWVAVIEELVGKDKIFTNEEFKSIITRICAIHGWSVSRFAGESWSDKDCTTQELVVWLVDTFLADKYELIYALMAVVEHLTNNRVDYL
jgi:hypothetical protein